MFGFPSLWLRFSPMHLLWVSSSPTPHWLNGQTVKVETQVIVNFQLAAR
jgi:hypothetical protein